MDLISKADKVNEDGFVLELAKITTGFDLAYWSDNKINDFEEILRDAFNKLNDYNPDKELQQGEIKLTIETADGDSMITQFSNVELSPTGKTMLNKMKNTLGGFGESISQEEKISILTKIIKEVIY